MRKIDLDKAKKRARFFAETLCLEPPAELLADDGGPGTGVGALDRNSKAQISADPRRSYKLRTQ